MQRIFLRRVVRDIRKYFVRYLLLFLLIVFGMFLVTAVIGGAETVIYTVENSNLENHVEDGCFSVLFPLSEEDIREIEAMGVTLEEEFYTDFPSFENSIIRVYKNRKEINLVHIYEGEIPKSTRGQQHPEIVIERHYASEHNLTIGSSFFIGKEEFIVTGTCTTPDYDNMKKKISDIVTGHSLFGTAFVTEEAYDNLTHQTKGVNSEQYTYSYILGDQVTDKELKDAVSNLTEFVPRKDNTRIAASAEDIEINKKVGLLAGIIVMILFAYVISVFSMHSIEQESHVIGAFYALGILKKQLIISYLILPAVITLLGAVVGTVLGLSRFGMMSMIQESVTYYSTPPLEFYYPLYLFLYAIFMPPITAIVVNYVIIKKKLSQPVLVLLRKEQKRGKVRHANITSNHFIQMFQIKQFLRESRSAFAIMGGMCISLLIFMMGYDCYLYCDRLGKAAESDIEFEYMYVYKYPSQEIPEHGVEGYVETLKKSYGDYNFDISILGLTNDNPYFPYSVSKRKDHITISSAFANKYNVKVGDQVLLRDEMEELDYEFVVEDIVDYNANLYVFMDMESMRELFGKEKEYYNAVFSSEPLKIEADRLYSLITKEEICESYTIFVDIMSPMISSLFVASILIFCVVMYLMIKVMIDRSAYHISLVKIFGYRNQEIRKLYLDGNFIFIAISALICVPITKWVIDSIFPILVANVEGAVPLGVSWNFYLVIFAMVMVCYFVISNLLMSRIKKIMPADILKDRE